MQKKGSEERRCLVCTVVESGFWFQILSAFQIWWRHASELLSFMWVTCSGARGVTALLVPAASTKCSSLTNFGARRYFHTGRLNRLALQKAVGGQEAQEKSNRKGKGKEGEKHIRRNLHSSDFTSPHGFSGREAGVMLGIHDFDHCPTHMLAFPSWWQGRIGSYVRLCSVGLLGDDNYLHWSWYVYVKGKKIHFLFDYSL